VRSTEPPPGDVLDVSTGPMPRRRLETAPEEEKTIKMMMLLMVVVIMLMMMAM
jgi:hypothetical protein